MYKLIIKLKSPTHIHAKVVFGYRNVYDVCFDEYGFPYIPASALKGYLRNACQELRGLGVNIDDNEIFGSFDKPRSSFIIYDAKLRHYRFLKNAVINSQNKDGVFPLNSKVVIDYYTSKRIIRSKTHCTYISTLNKGLEFCSLFDIDKKYFDDFKLIVKSLKSIGKLKSHGFGEVSCSIVEDKVNKIKPLTFSENKNYVRMNISLTNLSKLCIKETYDLYNWTKSYIPGTSILGYIKSRLGNKIGDVRCSNLYLDINGKRSYPAPQCFYNKKIDETILCDKFSKGKRVNDADQLCKLDECYINSLSSENILYREVDNSDTTHYGVSSYVGVRTRNINYIKPFHKFDGFIEGDKKSLKLIYDELVSKPEINIGSFITRGYGRSRIEIVSLETKKENKSNMQSEFILMLNSQTYLKNENGLYTTHIDDFVSAVSKIVGTPLVCLENFQSYNKVANYNYIAQTARSHIFCYDKGSIYRFRTKNNKKIDINKINGSWVGELNNCGFGEVVVINTDGKYYRTFNEYEEKVDNTLVKDNAFGNALVINIIQHTINKLLLLTNHSYLIDTKKFSMYHGKLSFSDNTFKDMYKNTIAKEVAIALEK